jgi:MoxR-like ATPase
MEQNKIVQSKIKNVVKTLKSAVGYDEAVDALILGLVARENVMMIGPHGVAFNHLMWTLSKLVQAQLVTTISAEELPADDLRRLVFIKIEPDAVLPPRLVEEKNAWILVVAVNGDSGKTPALHDRFVKAFMQQLDGHDLVSAVKARWLYNYTPIASIEDIKAMHEYASSLLKREDVVKAYGDNVVPLIEELRKHVAVSDEYVIETLPKLYAAYLAIHGVSPENMIIASYDILQYIARTREELKVIERVVNENLKDVAALGYMLSDGRQMLETGDAKVALYILRDVATYDISHLKPLSLKKKAEVLINAANELIKKAQKGDHEN